MNIKMPTIVGILIFISRKNFMLSSVLQEKSLNWGFLIFISGTNFILSWVEHEKSFITSGFDSIKSSIKLLEAKPWIKRLCGLMCSRKAENPNDPERLITTLSHTILLKSLYYHPDFFYAGYSICFFFCLYVSWFCHLEFFPWLSSWFIHYNMPLYVLLNGPKIRNKFLYLYHTNGKKWF